MTFKEADKGFGSAFVKKEGDKRVFNTSAESAPLATVYVYIERRVPMHLEHAAHAAIDRFLRKNGVAPEDL